MVNTEYGLLKKQAKEYGIIKKNVDSILEPVRNCEQETRCAAYSCKKDDC
jgi:hypothetical protein